jgi:hypothetical protein
MKFYKVKILRNLKRINPNLNQKVKRNKLLKLKALNPKEKRSQAKNQMLRKILK